MIDKKKSYIGFVINLNILWITRGVGKEFFDHGQDLKIRIKRIYNIHITIIQEMHRTSYARFI